MRLPNGMTGVEEGHSRNQTPTYWFANSGYCLDRVGQHSDSFVWAAYFPSVIMNIENERAIIRERASQK